MANYKQPFPNQDKGMNLDIPLDDFIAPDDACRAIQQIVWSLDTSMIESTYSDIGQRGHHPKMLLSVIFYGYSQGIRSGRKLSDACSTDIRFIWLSQSSRPKKTVLNDFRHKHHKSFEGLFIQVVQRASEQGLIDSSDTLFGDGSKIRASANAKRTYTKGRYDKWMAHLKEDIAELSATENKEDDDPPDAFLQKQCLAKQARIEKIKDRLVRFNDHNPDRQINLTDPDACFMKGKKGDKDTYYNAQVVVTSNQIIVHSHVSSNASDRQELMPCLEGVKAVMGQYPNQSVWDAGYSSFSNEEYLDQTKQEAFIPDQEFGKTLSDQPFHHHHFQYDPDHDRYICPQGKTMIYKRQKNTQGYQYRVYQGTQCKECPCRPQCTKAKARTVQREQRQFLRDQMNYRLLTTEGKRLSGLRKHTVEPVFGHLKHNLGYRYFLLRSMEKVNAEFTIMCTAFNLMKMAKSQLGKIRSATYVRPYTWLFNPNLLVKGVIQLLERLQNIHLIHYTK